MFDNFLFERARSWPGHGGQSNQPKQISNETNYFSEIRPKSKNCRRNIWNYLTEFGRRSSHWQQNM